ncbi:hypothetical protein AKJ16_DCAP05012 [Drosera capensis]
METSLTPPSPRASPSSSSIPTRLLPLLIPTRLHPPPHLTLYSPFSLRLRRRQLSFAASITPLEEDANKEAEKEEEKDEDVEEEERIVREAIAETLLEFGASEEESEEIVAKSVAYARMLRDEVRELDENSLWKSWLMERRSGVAGEEEIEELSLKRKVKIARALSKLTLKGLIRRVKYVNEIFFSGSDDQIIVGSQVRWLGHVRIRRSFPLCPYRVIPGILSLPMEATIEHPFKFLEEIGVPRQRFESILLLYPPILFLDIKKEIKPGIHAYYKADILRRIMGKMLKKVSLDTFCKHSREFCEGAKVTCLSCNQALSHYIGMFKRQVQAHDTGDTQVGGNTQEAWQSGGLFARFRGWIDYLRSIGFSDTDIA